MRGCVTSAANAADVLNFLAPFGIGDEILVTEVLLAVCLTFLNVAERGV